MNQLLAEAFQLAIIKLFLIKVVREEVVSVNASSAV